MILVVDDDPELRQVLRLILDEYEVLDVPDGPAALEIVGSRRVDFILLDVLLPGIDGIELLSRLRTGHPEIPVILITGAPTTRTTVAAMKLGAMDYLVKPFDPEELRTLIRDALARQVGQRSVPKLDARVLIVGTDIIAMGTLQVALATRLHVEVVGTLPEALERLRTRSYAAVLLDDSVTPVDSLLFLRTLHARLPTCPVIVLAGNREPWTTPDFAPLAIDAILAKPYRLNDLVAHVTSALAIHPESRTSNRFNSVVSRAIDYLRDHYDRTSTMVDVASTIGVSPGRLSRLFRADLGITPRQFLLKVRIEMTKHLLRNTDMKIDAIAELVGFDHASHLSRLFKHYVGSRPGQYRRRSPAR